MFVGCFEAGWSQQDQHSTLQKSELVLIDTEQCQEQADDGDKVKSYLQLQKRFKLRILTTF